MASRTRIVPALMVATLGGLRTWVCELVAWDEGLEAGGLGLAPGQRETRWCVGTELTLFLFRHDGACLRRAMIGR